MQGCIHGARAESFQSLFRLPEQVEERQRKEYLHWQEQQRQQAAALAASVFPCHTCFNQEELELKRREDEAHEPSLQLLLRGLKWTSQAIDAIGRKAQNFE